MNGEEIPESFDVREAQKWCKIPVVDQNKKCTGSYVTAVAFTLAVKLYIEADEKN